ncbi:hypothetical protein HJG60_010543 [Phyllostomus discolor]|uniref:Uncharacterized protein n=1 Tax=Phyllostomus discolor TaxID=89673 RepID=A0A834ANC1_9CHIR|nr:hypothetical protein HJG60_010543 [Phyllostomus discolor]
MYQLCFTAISLAGCSGNPIRKGRKLVWYDTFFIESGVEKKPAVVRSKNVHHLYSRSGQSSTLNPPFWSFYVLLYFPFGKQGCAFRLWSLVGRCFSGSDRRAAVTPQVVSVPQCVSPGLTVNRCPLPLIGLRLQILTHSFSSLFIWRILSPMEKVVFTFVYCLLLRHCTTSL